MNYPVVFVFITLSLLNFGLTAAQALPLQNGDFASFAGWKGYLYDGASSTAVDPATNSHYSLPGGGQAQLADDNTYFDVSLEQTFDLPANTLEIIFDFSWNLSSPGTDFTQAVLIDSAGNMLDLLAGVDRAQANNTGTTTTAIGNLAGQTVTLRFELQDGDFVVPDTFSIGNIHITQSAQPMPVPATLLLFSSGLLGLALRQWQFSRRG